MVKAVDLFQGLWKNEKLEEWQKEPLERILTFLADNRPGSLFMAVTGANGIGKTSLMAWVVILAIRQLHANGRRFKGSLYSGKFDQLKATLIAEIKMWIDASETPKLFRYSGLTFRSAGGRSGDFIEAKAWSPQEKGTAKVAGQHADTNIILIDEATAVPRFIHNRLNGSTTDRKVLMLLACNPDMDVGFVYDLFRDRPYGWVLYQIPHSALTFRRNREFEDRTLARYGEDSDVYRMQVLGLFPKSRAGAFISREYIEACQARVPITVSKQKCMGVDVASGEGVDFSTIIIREGGKIIYLERRICTLQETFTWVSAVARKFNIKIFAIDEVGVGCGIYQQLRDGEFPGVIGVNGAHKPINKVRFYNRRAELYEELREWIVYLGHIPKREEFVDLINEIASLEVEYRGTQKLMQSKKEMEKSPDLADALAYTFAVPQENEFDERGESSEALAMRGGLRTALNR